MKTVLEILAPARPLTATGRGFMVTHWPLGPPNISVLSKNLKVDLEEENLKVRHKRKDNKEAVSQPQHSQARKKQKVAHKSNPGKFTFTRKAEDEPSESKVKKVKNLTDEGKTKDNIIKLGANSNVDILRESPKAKAPPDPPKSADVTKRPRLTTNSKNSKDKNQTSMFNFISRSSASRGQDSSSRKPVLPSPPPHSTTQLTQNFIQKWMTLDIVARWFVW